MGPLKAFSDLLASANSASHSEQMWSAKEWVLKPPSMVCVFGGGWFGLAPPWSRETPGGNLPMANFKYGPGVWSFLQKESASRASRRKPKHNERIQLADVF